MELDSKPYSFLMPPDVQLIKIIIKRKFKIICPHFQKGFTFLIKQIMP